MTKQADSVPALRRAVRVLDMVRGASHPPLAADVARQLGLPRSTTHGLLAVMVELGLLEKTVNHGYRIGTRLLEWVGGAAEKRDLVAEFYHALDGFSGLDSFTITLTLLEGMEVVYVACRSSQTGLSASFRVGMRLPAIFTATGSAILAEMDDTSFREWLTLYPASAWPEPLTSKSVCSVTGLVREIAVIRERGYAVDSENVYEGLWCAGAVVRDYSGHVVAGLGISLLQAEVGRYDIASLGNRAMALAQAVSKRLGYRSVSAA
ncbi:IclR family transcriptional regulator [Acetobacter thailandicus]|nr:IclR family transcriptional regulator [Acetobacter thailandicus]OUI88072.1 IclR family transcriptional regulator [Acetobacter sp. DmW_043]OUJ09884.1 IclR family transcriptional regulator [Acetobacter sp. DsW_059]MBS0980631.1 IclR family transcriptional regulator [Acetobacter thailandicus]MBS0984663.1 IclR family transcriptional regulator [Acetobacter thailandicus]